MVFFSSTSHVYKKSINKINESSKLARLVNMDLKN